MGKAATLSLLHLRFIYEVIVYGDLPPIWGAVSRGIGRMEGMASLNQALMQGLPYCRNIFGGRAQFSASLPLLAFVNSVSLLNPSLDPVFTWGGSRPS